MRKDWWRRQAQRQCQRPTRAPLTARLPPAGLHPPRVWPRAPQGDRVCARTRGWRASAVAAGRAERGGAGAVKEKNIPRPANCCSQRFPSSCLGGREKKAELPLEAGAKGMRNFNHLLHPHPSGVERGPCLAQRHPGSGDASSAMWEVWLRPGSREVLVPSARHCPLGSHLGGRQH